MDSINGRLSSLFSLARNTVQGTDQRDGSEPSDAGSRPPSPRDPSEPPPIHQTGRRRPAALAQPSSESPSPFTRLPLEMQQAVLPYLDPESTIKLAQSSRQMKDMVYRHPHALRIARLLSAPPSKWSEPAYSTELRDCSEHLSAEQFRTLALRGLPPRDHPRGWLLGPLLSGRTRRDAEWVAQTMDSTSRPSTTRHARPDDPVQNIMRLGRMHAMLISGAEDPFPPGRATDEQRNRQHRGHTLLTMLDGIGKPKNPDVYEPFLERCARPSLYAIDPIDLEALLSRIRAMLPA